MVVLCQLNRIVIQSSLEPVYLNDSLRCKMTAEELRSIITKPFVKGRYLEKLCCMSLSKFGFESEQYFLTTETNDVRHTHTWNSNIVLQGLCPWAIGCLMDTGLENTSSRLQNIGAGGLETWY